MRHSHLIKPLLGEHYPVAIKGEGIYIIDDQGRRYLDGCSGAVAANVGHGVAEFAELSAQQMKEIAFTYRSQFTNVPAEKLATKLVEQVGNDFAGVFLVNSGSEAVETAMKISIQYWQEKGRPQKRKIISRWMSYHGITMGALSASGHPVRRERFAHELEEYPVLEPPYCYRCPFNLTYPSCNLLCASQLEVAIQRLGADQVAAFIAEPVIGAAGAAITPPPGYDEAIENICRRHEILFIADEVMSGCGRTGKMLAIHHSKAVPDLICLGKGLGAGYTPIAAVLVQNNILQAIAAGSGSIMSGHTFSANPLSASIALAVLEKLEKKRLVESVQTKADYLRKLLSELEKESAIIGDVRGIGLLVGIEFVHNKKTKVPFPPNCNVTDLVVRNAKEEGLLVYPASAGNDGRSGAAILVAPPLTITKKQIRELVSKLCKAVRNTEKALFGKENADELRC